MKRELLDLNIHDAEEFEGKIVVWNDCDYIVGKYVGSGVAIFTHELVNPKSGLCLHALKIWRDTAQARYHMEKREFALLKEYFTDFMPTTITVFSHGGAFDIQDYLGPFEDEATSTAPLIKKANDALKNSENQLAIDYYKQVLEINPYHTVALNNLANVLLRIDDYSTAYTIMLQVLSIEPNYLPYYRAATYIATLLGYGRSALQLFNTMKNKFTINLSLQDYDLGINILLEMGLPQEADELFKARKQYYAEDEENDQIEQLINGDRTAQKKASDLINVMSIKEIISLSDEKLVPLLENAYAIYKKDPHTKINLALAYQRIGKFDKAKQLIFSVVRNIHPMLENVCIFHLAYGAMRTQNCAEALHWLDATATTLRISDPSQYEENGLSLLADMPSITRWVDKNGSQVAERLENTVSFVQEIITRCGSTETIPKNVTYLFDLYEKGLEQYLTSTN